jgi:glycine cleavage system T protein (aminomethyltransferase)
VKISHLYEFNKQHGKMTEFGGFAMPLWYSGIIEEHNSVRNRAGLFDVSHMGRFSIKGRDATLFLNNLLPSDASKVKVWKAFYSTILNETGGIMDDTVTEKLSNSDYLMVVNAANRKTDFLWLEQHSRNLSLEIRDESEETALIAFQGPLAIPLINKISDSDISKIPRFGVTKCLVNGRGCLVSRTGYTGEDGVEIAILDTTLKDPSNAVRIWEKLLTLGKDKGVLPCGLGARDSLRLEAGMCLHGQDIDEHTTPVEAGLENIVSVQKKEEYVGRTEIEKQLRNGPARKRISFSMESGGIPRHGYGLKYSDSTVGSVTSGTFSPTLKKGIGMGYVPLQISATIISIIVQIRGEDKVASIVKPPFYDTSKYGYRRLQIPKL